MTMTNSDRNLSVKYEQLNLETFRYTEHKPQDIENDIDPDNNFYIGTHNQCEYYTVEQFKKYIKMDGTISIIHFNSRSLIANLSKIKQCLKQVENKFTAIAITETWLMEEHHDLVEIEGYKLFIINRKQSIGGGVTLYIDQRYQCKIVNKMTFALDRIMECITVQIEMEKSKNILISCIYRKPGSNIDMFKEKITEIFSNSNNKKNGFYLRRLQY